MKKLWFSSLLLSVVLATGCQRHTANESGSDADSLSATNDSLAPADRTHVEVDTVSLSRDSIVAQPDTIGGSGDSKRPGQMPKPGTPSKVDSIKNSYPKKK